MVVDLWFGQDVLQPNRHEHVVWDLHLPSGELDTQGFGDGSLSWARMKRLARGEWGGAVLSEDVKVTAKLHGPGHHSGGERCLLVVLSAHQCAGRHFLHGYPERATSPEERNGAQHLRAVHPRVDLETDLGTYRPDGATPHSCEMGEGSRDDAARARRHDLAVALAASERAGGRAGEERLGSALVCQTVSAELSCKGPVPGLVGKVPGSSSRRCRCSVV